MPKHLLLGMSIRHLTGSAEVITILNRYGHCYSYAKILELVTAVALQVSASDSLLPCNVSRNGSTFIHLCWDNFDINEVSTFWFRDNTFYPWNSHSKISNSHLHDDSSLEIHKTKQRRYMHKQTLLEPCVAKGHTEPDLTAMNQPTESTNVFSQ
jgi:hypothetical protein